MLEMLANGLVNIISPGVLICLLGGVTVGLILGAIPDVPTAIEQGYDVAYTSYSAFAFPAGTDQSKIDTIKAAFDKAVQDQAFLDTCARLKVVTEFMDGATYTEKVTADRDMYEELFGPAS